MSTENLMNKDSASSAKDRMQRFSYKREASQLQSSSMPSSSACVQGKVKTTSAPPPVPPRHPTSSVSSTRYPPMGYGSHMYNMGFGSRAMPYSSYGGLNGLGYGGRYPYSGGGYYGDVGNPDNMFIRMAEESSRPAFQSIESLVSAVSSISMMLESTYHAVYSSYRAVLGVVDQFARLRNHLAQVLSTLALIRTLQWLCQKFLRMLGLWRTDPSAEAAWTAATSSVVKANEPGPVDAHTSWPIFMFMGLVFGAPWIIYRIFSKMASKKGSEFWNPVDKEQMKGMAMYDFRAAHHGELSVRRGQMILICPRSMQPKVAGWTLISTDNHTTGLVPTSYLRRIVIKQSAAAAAAPIPTTPPPSPSNELPTVEPQEEIVSPAEVVNESSTDSNECAEDNENLAAKIDESPS